MYERKLILFLSSLAVGLLASLCLLPKWVVCAILIIALSLIVTVFILMHMLTRKFHSFIISRSAHRNASLSQMFSRLHSDLKELIRPKRKPQRLPAVFGRLIDDALQKLIYLTLRDFVGAWNTEQGFGGSEQLTQDIRDDVWKVVQILQERLWRIDEAKLICVDITNRVLQHFEKIRITNANFAPLDQPPVYEVLPHLSSPYAEKEYLRQLSTALIVLFFPQTYSNIEPVKHLIRELLACKVLFPAIETLTDPDFINMKILSYIEKNQVLPEQYEGRYDRPARFEDFIQLIKGLNDIDALKHIRYDIVTDIMTAATAQTQYQDKGMEPSEDLKRFINKLTFAKNQCEKRLHSLGWMGYPVEVAVEASASTEEVGEIQNPPSVRDILNNSAGRRYLVKYLAQVESPEYVGYWEAVEQLRKAPRSVWHALGAEIFYTYIRTPSRPIRISRTDCKCMEEFLLGNGGTTVFFEVQSAVVDILSDKLYPSFLVTDLFRKMQTEMESQKEEEPGQGEPIPSTSNADSEQQQSRVDQSNYTRKKLSQLEERISNKMQALEALRTSLKPESRVLTTLEAEVESLQGELRQTEAHLTRTEEWGEHLGQWRAIVQLAEMSEDKECPQFVLVVHHEDNKDSDSVSTGWVVLRKLQDFQELHRKLSQLSSDVKNVELPTQSLKYRLGKTTVQNALEKAKVQIQKYLQFILEDERLNQSEALYTFLSPSSDHLKNSDLDLEPKRFKFSISTMFKNNGWETGPLATALGQSQKESVDDSSLLEDDLEGSKSTADVKDTIAEPLYLLLNELCRLNTKFNWIRRTIITTIQLTYNRSINRAVRVIIREWFSEQNIFNGIMLLIQSWWPEDYLITASTEQNELDKQKTKEEAHQRIIDSIPLLLSNLVGHQSARLAANTVFDVLQNPLLNKHIFYEILEVLLFEVCPEMKTQ